MNPEPFLQHRRLLRARLAWYERQELLRRDPFAPALVAAHLDKAKHNLRFVGRNMEAAEFNDWTIVGLYYAVYHAGLALIAKQGYVSKHHDATLLLLIERYALSREDTAFIHRLRLTKDDAEFYARLKERRRQASYATSTIYKDAQVRELREKAVLFLQKAEDLLEARSA